MCVNVTGSIFVPVTECVSVLVYGNVCEPDCGFVSVLDCASERVGLCV